MKHFTLSLATLCVVSLATASQGAAHAADVPLLPKVPDTAATLTRAGRMRPMPSQPPCAKATLSVDHVFESVDKKRSEGNYDPHEWRAKRTVSLSADLAAQAASPTPRCRRSTAHRPPT